MQTAPLPQGRASAQWQQSYQRRAFGELFGELWDRIIALDESSLVEGRTIATKLQNCCMNPAVIAVDDGSRYYISESRCRSRVCPRCSRMRSRQLAGRIRELIGKMDDPRFLTLTIRSNDEPLADQVKHLRRRFAAMRRTDDWKEHVTQGVYTIEITWNEASEQWHPHLHAIIDGQFWAQAQILELWERIVADRAGVDIRAVHGVRKLANYLACYVAKSCDLSLLPPERLAEWACETHGLRLAQTFGGLHGCKPQNDDAEPAVHHHIALDPRDLAYEAAQGQETAEKLLQMIEPNRRRLAGQDRDLISALICSFVHPFEPPKPPKPPPKARQLWLGPGIGN